MDDYHSSYIGIAEEWLAIDNFNARFGTEERGVNETLIIYKFGKFIPPFLYSYRLLSL
jgi:hypothetical protein